MFKKNKCAFLLSAALFVLPGCGPEALQNLDYYLLNPDKLEKATKFCQDPANRSNPGYCSEIARILDLYDNIEHEFNTRQMLYLQYSGFYPEIDKKAEQELTEAKRLLKLKKQGLKERG